MRGAKLKFGVVLAVALTAAPALAEVRLVEDPIDGSLLVDITSTPRGPWTPTGSVTPRILNPAGDLFGDTMPGWDTRGSNVQSAWIRPGTGILHRSLGISPGWISLASIDAPGAYGQPVVDVLTGGWSICWQQAGGSRRDILVTGTLPTGVAVDPVVVSDGTLIGTVPSGNLLQILSVSANGAIWCTTVSFGFVPTQPIPITIQVIGRVLLGHAGNNMGLGSNMFGDGQDAGLASADPRLTDLTSQDGDSSSLLTWWTNDRDLSSVVIGEDGPVLPVTPLSGRKGSRHDEKLVEQAIRQAEKH